MFDLYSAYFAGKNLQNHVILEWAIFRILIPTADLHANKNKRIYVGICFGI